MSETKTRRVLVTFEAEVACKAVSGRPVSNATVAREVRIATANPWDTKYVRKVRNVRVEDVESGHAE